MLSPASSAKALLVGSEIDFVFCLQRAHGAGAPHRYFLGLIHCQACTPTPSFGGSI